jgi:hypothetical protein
MALSEKEQKFISVATAALHALMMRSRPIEDEVRTYSTRSRKIANAFRKKAIDKVFDVAGVNQKIIADRQEANNLADKKFLQSIRPKIDANSIKIKERQKRSVEIFGKAQSNRHKPGPDLPPPPEFAILNVADSITSLVPGNVQQSTSAAAWNNTARIWIKGNFAGGDASFTWSFLWTPPADGNLSVAAVATANGSNFWASQHGCVEALMEQSVEVAFAVAQSDDPDNPQILDEENVYYKHWDDRPGCSTDLGMNIIDKSISMVVDNVFPVQAGRQIVVMAYVDIFYSGDEALGDIDFFNSAKDINIPGVIVSLLG